MSEYDAPGGAADGAEVHRCQNVDMPMTIGMTHVLYFRIRMFSTSESVSHQGREADGANQSCEAAKERDPACAPDNITSVGATFRDWKQKQQYVFQALAKGRHKVSHCRDKRHQGDVHLSFATMRGVSMAVIPNDATST